MSDFHIWPWLCGIALGFAFAKTKIDNYDKDILKGM